MRTGDPNRLNHTFSARGGGGDAGWFRFVNGHSPGYPEHILQASYHAVAQALDEIRRDDTDPKKVYIQHWIHKNPVICNALVQLTTGSPNPIYHGGLLLARLRYFDSGQECPGLPSDVSALIDQIQVKNPQKESFRLQLVNLSPIHCRKVYLQAGTFGQHSFEKIKVGQTTHSIDSKWSEVRLPPATSIEMRISLARFVNTPSYDTPLKSRAEGQPTIKTRNPNINPGNVSFSWKTGHPINEEENETND